MNKRPRLSTPFGILWASAGNWTDTDRHDTDLDLDRTVLLPIDMQRGFDEPSWPRRWNDRMDANGLALLAEWRSAGRPIIHVRHDSVEPGSTLTPGTPGNAFRPGFGPVGDEPLITKSVNSAFIGTDLDLRLKRLGAKHVVTFGISTDSASRPPSAPAPTWAGT